MIETPDSLILAIRAEKSLSPTLMIDTGQWWTSLPGSQQNSTAAAFSVITQSMLPAAEGLDKARVHPRPFPAAIPVEWLAYGRCGLFKLALAGLIFTGLDLEGLSGRFVQ